MATQTPLVFSCLPGQIMIMQPFASLFLSFKKRGMHKTRDFGQGDPTTGACFPSHIA
jgi:hypothetical protein